MQDNLAAIERLTREHEQALDRIGGIYETVRDLTSLRQKWVPGSPPDFEQKLAQLRESLDSIDRHLQEHLRFEEHEFLPILAKYAADIIRGGLLSEHRGIRDSIADVREKVKELGKKPADREEMMAKEIHVRESLGMILNLAEEHAHTQEVIFNLAREALTKERE